MFPLYSLYFVNSLMSYIPLVLDESLLFNVDYPQNKSFYPFSTVQVVQVNSFVIWNVFPSFFFLKPLYMVFFLAYMMRDCICVISSSAS